MTTDSKRSKALFLIARGITDSKLRIEYLDRECGEDTELRQRVEVLLSAPDETTGYNLQQHVSRGVEHEVCPAIPERGALLGGRYRLQEPLGEGGMGSVWLAEQTEPVKRTVAAKLIKPGMDSQQVLARFDAERQALAMMDHPNIAKVFDGGMTAEGRPFFVMEYVKGVPLIEYCDGIQLSLSNRLRLFIQICHAIQHAHQKGIIHRDLKPSNILVYEYDGTPVPKVIDFGLAKAMHQSLTEQSLYTAQGMMIGTPLYMSPEQVDRNHLDIDTRSDIYALGVVLYELLTGSTPLERKQMERATYSEILRLIKEVEPPRPSARISRSDGLPRIASQRRLEPSQLTKTLTGDLDWIVMKSLDKDRDRRYETANALSRDVERFLNDEPVAAYPPSVSYRFKKMIRKYKRHVLAVSMVVVAMVGGVLAVVVMQAQKNHELRTLNIQLDEANTELKSTNIRLDKQREVAEEREQQAINAVKKFGDTIAENPELKNNPSLDALRKTLLKEPITFLQSLRDQLEQVESPSKKSLAQLAFANLELAKLTDEIGNKQDALHVIQVSIEIWNRLLQANPEVVAYRHSLAVSYVTSGSLLEDVGRMSEVMPQYQRAAQLLQELNLEQPEDFGFGKNLMDVVTLMGNVELGAGQLDKALEYYDTALGISTRFVPDATETSSYQHSLGNLYHNIGYVHAQRGQSDLSLEMYKKAVEVQEKLTIQEPANTKFKSSLAHTYTNIG
ncbi:MAG: serine/threonine protein kinase, partial [Planctomycetaceae bacterium]|nr:serine/threonine protein kinase [Planctomycetaceae bacterium]